jgi:ATP adenylyltransferase/5',5'''-P-1,P-4-tetraphosphate phosphorylase II
MSEEETDRTHCSKLQVQLRICPALLTKPHTVGAAPSSHLSKSRTWGLGSDMFVPDERIIITHLNGGTHDLAVNAFCVDRPQLLALTRDCYKRQDQPLDAGDFEAALELMRRLPAMYVIYNCSEAAGCSRMHKHMQGLRGPPYAFEALTVFEEVRKAPFQYFAHKFNQGYNASSLSGVYDGFLGQARTLLGLGDSDVCPHNVVLWADWMFVIPRRRAFWEGTSANAAGMAGSMWVPERKFADKWLELGPANVLREFGIPR